MRGQKSNALKLLEGNRRKVKTASLTAEPQAVGMPRLPVHLTAEEQRLWADVVASLPLGLLTRADEGALERYAVAWSRFRETQIKIRQTGVLVQSSWGPIRNPLLIVQERAAMEMNRAGAELGLSPAARSRMTAPDTAGADPMELLLGPEGDPNGAWATPGLKPRR